MNFLNPYSRTDYKDFFQNKFLTDDFEFIEEILSLEFKPLYLKQVELLGKDKSLELDIYEILHESDNDPRVGLSKDIFRLMSKYGSKRAVAILYSPNTKNYRLSLATVELSLEGSKIKREYSNPRRYSFFLGPDSKIHTPTDFLIKKGKVKDFYDLQNRFSIEVVNKEFYKEIANWYFWALKKVKFPDDAEVEMNGRNTSVIRLITRLIFIWFMKVRKLIPEELFNEDTLKGILKDFKTNNDNYYKAILQNLFFATLNTKQNDRRFTSKNRGYKGFSNDFGNHNVYRYEEAFTNSEETIEKIFLTIPFLNGGLFECLDYKTKLKDERKYIDGFTSTKSQQPSVPNFLFFNEDKTFDLNKDYGTTNKQYEVRGLLNTLSLYNFTIDEIDPNDADVALDPELLGKVFENLLASYNPETANTARKSTGSFYTPRLIVDFMVDESLKQYFKTHIILDDIDSKLEILFSNQFSSNPFDKSTTERLVSLIDSLRVVDPAVGSGAFPMRLLNRLVFLLHKLDSGNTLWKESQIDGVRKNVKDPIIQKQLIEQIHKKFSDKNPDYGRKLYLIEKCIYGVDIQQIAVEIAKLRFFISLLVDEKIDFNKRDGNYGIEPLPNLDFKLMQGNSLISSFAGIDFNSQAESKSILFEFEADYKKLITEFEELKSQHQNESDVNSKKKLKDRIDENLLQIFREKIKLQYPQLNELERKYSGIKNEKQRLEILSVEKKKLFKKIGIDLIQAEQDLIAYTEGRKQKDFFLWDIYFAEVFAENGGFDIVVGNPPYVNVEKIDVSIKNNIKKYKTAYQKYDLYVLFYEKGIELLKPNGQIIYITSNKFLSQGYGLLLRKEFLNYFINQLINFNYDIFEAATVRTCIFHLQKTLKSSNEKIKIINVETLNDSDKFHKRQYNYLNQDIFLETDENNFRINLTNKKLTILNIIASNTTRVDDIFSVNYGLRPSSEKLNLKKEAFIHISNPTRKFKKYFEGKDMGNWLIKNYSYLDYQPDVMYNAMFPELFETEKLVGLRTLSDITKLRFIYDNEKYYCNDSVVVLTFWHLFNKVQNQTLLRNITKNKIDTSKEFSYLYVQAILNSRLIKFYVNELFYDGTHFYPNHMKALPIKKLEFSKQQLFIDIVSKIHLLLKPNPAAKTMKFEDQIDIMVYKLYNLTYEDVKIIDPEIEKIISEKDFEKMEI